MNRTEIMRYYSHNKCVSSRTSSGKPSDGGGRGGSPSRVSIGFWAGSPFVCAMCILAIIGAAVFLFPYPSNAAGEIVVYNSDGLPDSAVAGQVADFRVNVFNIGSVTISDLWFKLDIYEPGGAKVENTRTDFIDPDTQAQGLLVWGAQGRNLPPEYITVFLAGYSFRKSATDHVYQPGVYTLRYRAWIGQPGAVGSEPIGAIQEKTLTILPVSAPDKAVPILMYHRVDDVAPDEYWVSTAEFEAQMKALVAYGYEAVSTGDIYDYNYNGSPLPTKPVAITFDDGYENMYTRAYPILLEQGLFGEFYIVTDVTASADYDRKYSFLPGRGILANPHLIWPEIIEMASGGMVFGSHTKSHRDLTTLTYTEQEDEILGSHQELMEQAGIDATSFSYPLGAGNGDVAIHQMLARNGYLTAASAWRDICQTQTADTFDLKRVYIYGPNPASNPGSAGVSVNYDPLNPDDFFMTQIDPAFAVPSVTIESVEFLDELGTPRQYNRFYTGERILIRVTARNDGDGAWVAVSLKLDDDGVGPLAYDSRQAVPSEDIVRFFAATTGSAETFEFVWEVPADASTNLYDYSVEFRDSTDTLGFALSGWAPDMFAVCGGVHLYGPGDGAFLTNPPAFSWHPGCSDLFIVEFSFDQAFGAAVRSPVLSTSTYTPPQALWNAAPLYRTIYWRVRGAESVLTPPVINTSAEVWSFQKY